MATIADYGNNPVLIGEDALRLARQELLATDQDLARRFLDAVAGDQRSDPEVIEEFLAEFASPQQLAGVERRAFELTLKLNDSTERAMEYQATLMRQTGHWHYDQEHPETYAEHLRNLLGEMDPTGSRYSNLNLIANVLVPRLIAQGKADKIGKLWQPETVSKTRAMADILGPTLRRDLGVKRGSTKPISPEQAASPLSPKLDQAIDRMLDDLDNPKVSVTQFNAAHRDVPKLAETPPVMQATQYITPNGGVIIIRYTNDVNLRQLQNALPEPVCSWQLGEVSKGSIRVDIE